MSLSSQDKLLSTLTGGATNSSTTTKTIDMSPHGNPREWFHPGRKFIGCAEEMDKQGLSLSDCVNARAYCEGIMGRYIALLDFATFMPSEHIQKEKEYGITWRTAFKKELSDLVGIVVKKLINTDDDESLEPFEVIHKVVKKDCLDGATFDARTQADLICMLNGNLEMLELCIMQIKALLKEPSVEQFAAIKQKTVEQVKASQK